MKQLAGLEHSLFYTYYNCTIKYKTKSETKRQARYCQSIQKNYCFIFHLAGESHPYFVSGIFVKRITRALEECKLDITLACFLYKSSTLRTTSVNKIIGGGGEGGGQCSTSAAPAMSLKGQCH